MAPYWTLALMNSKYAHSQGDLGFPLARVFILDIVVHMVRPSLAPFWSLGLMNRKWPPFAGI
jgi:hypothetical protein